ncbi:hypothetical protein PENNAL_c0105G07365 [Penicillium nalgiovense]|uniref:Uncharacterized protein n=1 Tax=Penicillium nalgiovense TaxID=60175 RepID=A0A1V6X8N3_PENNA|nr:hypothetical protein PENNAL_c0105G07365 [Penicillium nalgiovense]
MKDEKRYSTKGEDLFLPFIFNSTSLNFTFTFAFTSPSPHLHLPLFNTFKASCLSLDPTSTPSHLNPLHLSTSPCPQPPRRKPSSVPATFSRRLSKARRGSYPHDASASTNGSYPAYDPSRGAQLKNAADRANPYRDRLERVGQRDNRNRLAAKVLAA